VRANPAGILLMVQLATAALSAVLNNVSTVLLMAHYLAYGAPLTLVSIAICQVYVWLRYFFRKRFRSASSCRVRTSGGSG
jgi:hypothetical protein